MSIKRIENKTEYLFMDIHGGGWQATLVKIIETNLKPHNLKTIVNKAGWHSSGSNITFEIEEVKYTIHLDEYDSISIKSTGDVNELEKVARIIDKKTANV